MFESALVQQAAILEAFAWRYPHAFRRSDSGRSEAYRLLEFLELFAPLFPDGVPANSVLREFMGGSGFSY